MSSMESKNTKIEEVLVDEKRGRVLVSVSLSPRVGRERTVRINAADVRAWLQSERKIQAEALISGNAIHNNMSRRLGAHRTVDDLSSVFVFALKQPEPKAKAAPKKTTAKAKTTTAKPKVTATKSPEKAATTKVEKKTPSRRRSTTTTRRKSTTVKKGDK